MSKKKRRGACLDRKFQQTQVPHQTVNSHDQSVLGGLLTVNDAYVNPVAGLGAGQDDIIGASTYLNTRLTQNYMLMTSLYRGEWIARRIIDTIPEDMCKNWYNITSQLEADALKKMETLERKTSIKQRIMEGLRWGRLYGGAAAVIIIDGQQDMLSEPLDLRTVLPGQFKGLLVADRWSGVYPSTEVVEDMSDPEFGLPDYYTFSTDSKVLDTGIRVHHSRVIRFTGRDLPYTEQLAESNWGMSEMEHVYTELTKRDAVSANLAQMIFQANLRVLKMADLGEMLTSTSPVVQKQMYRTLQVQNRLATSMGVQVMDKDDAMESHQYSFAGLPELYRLFMLDVAGAAEIPATKLFGMSPEGMNATGESDLTNYYDSIKQKQETTLRPILEKLLPIMAMSAWGAVPNDIQFEFNPVRNSSDQERANLVQQTSASIISAFQSGLISQQTALRELRRTESYTSMWGSITDEEIETAENQTDMGELGVSGMLSTQQGGDDDEQSGQTVHPNSSNQSLGDAADSSGWAT